MWSENWTKDVPITIKWIKSPPYFKGLLLKDGHLYLRTRDNTLVCEHEQGKVMVLTCLDLFPKKEDICAVTGNDGRGTGDQSTGDIAVYICP